MGFFAKLFRGKSSSDSARLGQTWDDSLDVAVITTQEIVDGKRQHLSRWGFDVEAGRFTLKLQDGREVGAHGDIVGSYRPADHSWEWAWNNPNATLGRGSILRRRRGDNLRYSTQEPDLAEKVSSPRSICGAGLRKRKVYCATAGHGSNERRSPRLFPAEGGKK